MWKNKFKFAGKSFLGNYEYARSGKRIFKLKDMKTGRETKPYKSWQEAKKDDWYRI